MGKSEFSGRRPLSARIVIWQSRARSGSAGSMKRALVLLTLAMLTSPAAAVPGGEIDTLTIGRYTCELPGDALGPRGEHVPDADFAIVFGSSYRAKGVRGTYLLTGDQIVMTSGPRMGERYHRLTQGFLRKQNADGSDGDLRCVIANRTNTFAFSDRPANP
jgi:hypothetical protein